LLASLETSKKKLLKEKEAKNHQQQHNDGSNLDGLMEGFEQLFSNQEKKIQAQTEETGGKK